MLYYLGQLFSNIFGPMRLLKSHLFLIVAGISLAFFLVVVFLPRYFKRLPCDRGRDFAVDACASKGKPTGSGVVFITFFAVVAILVVPFDWRVYSVIVLTWLSMLSGWMDDRSKKPWGEMTKGLLDLLLALVISIILYEPSTKLWLPFTKKLFTHVSPLLFVSVSTVIIWVSINATNCTDGVDGLSSTLVLIGLISLGIFFYFILGHDKISKYLLLPFYPGSAKWAIMTFTMVGVLAGYLWHNAFPSKVLMGDAGSRALGFIIGVLVIKTGNPVFFLIVCSVILINGGTGLIKVALLRFFNIRIFHTVRFPLHDHFRHVRNWSITQVLIRFALIQIMLTIILFGLVIKVR